MEGIPIPARMVCGFRNGNGVERLVGVLRDEGTGDGIVTAGVTL